MRSPQIDMYNLCIYSSRQVFMYWVPMFIIDRNYSS